MALVAGGGVVMERRWLLPVVADASVPDERIAWTLAGLRDLPEPLLRMFWAAGIRVLIHPRFEDEWEASPWHGRSDEIIPWSRSGGWYDTDDAWVVVNGAYPDNAAEMRATLYHELGHAHHHLTGDAQRGPAFREAWKLGRRRVQEHQPRAYEARDGLGMYCIHWTRGTMEAWADAFAWNLGGRATIHPGFGDTFRECVAVVAGHLDQVQEAA